MNPEFVTVATPAHVFGVVERLLRSDFSSWEVNHTRCRLTCPTVDLVAIKGTDKAPALHAIRVRVTLEERSPLGPAAALVDLDHDALEILEWPEIVQRAPQAGSILLGYVEYLPLDFLQARLAVRDSYVDREELIDNRVGLPPWVPSRMREVLVKRDRALLHELYSDPSVLSKVREMFTALEVQLGAFYGVASPTVNSVGSTDNGASPAQPISPVDVGPPDWTVIDPSRDRLIAQSWWDGVGASVIGARFGLQPKTIRNKIGKLRSRYGQSVIPLPGNLPLRKPSKDSGKLGNSG